MTSATAQRLVLVRGMRPRVVELVEDVGVDAPRAPLAVVGLGRARRARPSRRTGGSPQRTPSNRIRRSRRTAAAPTRRARSRAVSSSTIAPRTWLRICSPRSATASEHVEDRLGARPVGRIAGRRVGRTASGTSPASPRRRSSRRSSPPGRARAGPASHRPAARRRGDLRVGLDARRRRRPGRPWRRPGTSWPLTEREEDDLRERRQPVDGAMRVRRSGRSRRWLGRSPRSALGQRRHRRAPRATASRRVPPGVAPGR